MAKLIPRVWPETITVVRAATLLLVLAGALVAPAFAGPEWGAGGYPSVAGEEPVWSLATPIGPLDYRTGRGLRVGKTGLNIGGFSSFEVSRDEGQDAVASLEGINFLVLYKPVERLQLFSEVEVGPLLEVDSDHGDVRSDPQVTIERLHADLSLGDRLNLRFGKFLTPIGRWNLVQAEPFVWTPSEPVLVERGFDETQSGAMVYGSFYPASRVLSYRVYGQFLDPIDVDADMPPAQRSIGARLEFGSARGDWSLGASALASELGGDWNFLGGLDGEWSAGRTELTTELIVADGDVADRDLWGVYLQGVYEVAQGRYLVGRYEHFDRAGVPAVNLADFGVAWIPRPYLYLKASYRFADRQTDEVARGFIASFAVVF
jgi:hypothetical protein